MMTDTDFISRLAVEIARKLGAPKIPLSVDLWDTEHVAAYLKKNPQVVRETIVCLPSFPKAIRLPTPAKGRPQARYKAVEVIAWAESYHS